MDKINSTALTCLAGVALLWLFLWSGTTKESVGREVENITAFAKLYGYIKYFHPSDEAMQIDWDAFAIHGVHEVKNARNQEELKESLESLFLPIAPTFRIESAIDQNEPFLARYVETLVEDTTNLTTVAWQHWSVDSKGETQSYDSRRVHTHDRTWEKKEFWLYQSLNATKLTGNQFKLRAVLKAHLEGEGSEGELYFTVNGESYRTQLSSENALCTTEGWREYEIETGKKNDIRQLNIGLHIKGTGSLLIDQVVIETRNENEDWHVISLNKPIAAELQPEFSDGLLFYSRNGYFDYTIETNCSASEGNSLRVNSPAQLFRNYPQAGETILETISDGLWIEVPLALYRNTGHTLPKADTVELQKLQNQLDTIDLETSTGNDENIRLANVVIAWNIFQHFYPYFDVIGTDWEQQLNLSLQRAIADETAEDFYDTLSKMLATLHDSHILRATHPSQEQIGILPFVVDRVENEIVVMHTERVDAAEVLEENPILPGDIIRTVDGIPAKDMVRSEMELISGSPQFSRFHSLRQFGRGALGSKANVIIDRSGETFEFALPRVKQSSILQKENIHLPVIGEIEEGIIYVDLDRASMNEINDHLERISAEKGVIFDLRGHPNNNSRVISHLLSEPDTSSQWMRIPQTIYPDQQNPAGYETRRWNLRPASPHIQGQVVFITDARARSYAESFLSFIEHYRLADIVGQPTAGANGNVNPVTLPGDYWFWWTGMKVLKHDGSQHHLIGIQPTVPVEKTIQAIREGRDEFLEKAIEILQ